ncbi:MAG: tetratricopeptide repeat protein [Ignavibacteriae bacterium]|nr:tetratricopeptide repeat protein [Ignavibacteriota bacterium]
MFNLESPSSIVNLQSHKIFFSSILFLFYVLNVEAQWSSDSLFNVHTQRGINYVYDLQFENARKEFKELIRLQPDHPAGHFFLATIEWERILIDLDNESNDERFITLLEKTIDVCDERLDKNEDDVTALFFKGGAIGFRGRLYANREDWVKAANDGRIALPIVQQAYKLAPANYDVLLGIGIYNYYAELIPEQYPFVKPLMIFFPDGDRAKGMNQLRQASEKANFANIEASYFLMQLLFQYEKQFGNALEIAARLHEKFPNNVVFHRYVGRCRAALGHWDEMTAEFDSILSYVSIGKLGYNKNVEREAHYYLGLSEMQNGRHDAALRHFYKADDLSRSLDKNGPSGFMIMSNLRVGMIYDAQSKREYAIKQYKKVLDMKEYQDSHKSAEKYLKTPYGK